ncbi:MAG: response regulator transcription factor [Anaerolineales bacterium]|nr:response regulator transcription factor [Anaerolineales bacterium]
MRLYVEAGKEAYRLIHSASPGSQPSKWLQNVLAAFTKFDSSSGEDTLFMENEVETLSKRELEVLVCISEGCTNQQIAERLVVSLNTVKKHTSNIYSKLGVRSRTQAIAAGREKGFIP